MLKAARVYYLHALVHTSTVLVSNAQVQFRLPFWQWHFDWRDCSIGLCQVKGFHNLALEFDKS